MNNFSLRIHHETLFIKKPKLSKIKKKSVKLRGIPISFVECGVFWLYCLFLACEQFCYSKATSIIPLQNANVNMFLNNFFYIFALFLSFPHLPLLTLFTIFEQYKFHLNTYFIILSYFTSLTPVTYLFTFFKFNQNPFSGIYLFKNIKNSLEKGH